MGYAEELQGHMERISAGGWSHLPAVERFSAEVAFAGEFAGLFPDKEQEWRGLILQAVRLVSGGLSAGDAVDATALAADGESIMAPIGAAAKEYTVHCCGHGHIDMNWMWPWQETVSIIHDTFNTVDKLMDEFPDFKYSQSQASTYAATEEYYPEVFEMIKRRIAEGRWEPTASMWVEGDKNLAGGEILCRHLLYTRRYFKGKFGLPYESIKIDWSPDTFGHAHTLPTILSRAGVSRYYHCRTGKDRWLLWWQGPDKSRVLLFLDKDWYNGKINAADITRLLADYIKETGLKDFLYMYGVGDHGGGPTRRDLRIATEMMGWPIFPKIILSTTDAYFTAIEKSLPSDLPVYDKELNFVFEGCYTSQSSIKLANQVSENVLQEVEAISVLAGAATGFPYPSGELQKGWRMAMFNQFHDILPGSGIHDTYAHSQGLFQEIQAIACSVRTRALRRLATQVDTSAATGVEPQNGSAGESLGAGAGDIMSGGVSSRAAGASPVEPLVVFNPLAYPRSEVVTAKVWNRDLPDDRIIVRDDEGNTVPGQVTHAGDYWGHQYKAVTFPVRNIPGMGYRTYSIGAVPEPVIKLPTYADPGPTDTSADTAPPAAGEVKMLAPYVMENEFLRVEVDPSSGAVAHLVDKSSGHDLVPRGDLLGLLELHREIPHAMTAWNIGVVSDIQRLDKGGMLTGVSNGSNFPISTGGKAHVPENMPERGPHRASIRVGHKLGDSRIKVEVGLSGGSRTIDFRIESDWREIGTGETGVPMLRIAFPTNLQKTLATYEIPFGSVQRPTDGHEVPALSWADLSGSRTGAEGSGGITLLNVGKYGHSADESTLRLTLLRSSYDPDPVPEVGYHDIRLGLLVHDGPCSASKATKAGAEFNQPMRIVPTDIHKGSLPVRKGFAEVLTSNVMLSALKKSEDTDAVIVRLYEMEGRETEAQVRLAGIVEPASPAVELDLMEQSLPASSARMDGDLLTVKIPAHGITSVKIGR